MKRSITISEDVWPLKQPFIISRSVRHQAHTLKVSIQEGDAIGVGAAVASARYGETATSVIEQIMQIKPELTAGLSRLELQKSLPAGAARNAVDAALWDLEAKLSGIDVGERSGLGWPSQVKTVQTISILSPQEMAAEAQRLKNFPVLKLKLNAELILERVRAVHEQAPQSELLIDANESWSLDILQEFAPQLAELGVVMLEQPLSAGQDEQLADYICPLPLYADESCHTRADLDTLEAKYSGINIKLDKTGGLTEAIHLMVEAKLRGFDVLVGCMLGSSLGIAPAMFIATQARYVDLDAPALLAKDEEPALVVDSGVIANLPSELWGGVN